MQRALTCLVCLLVCTAAEAATDNDLTSLSLEQLMNEPVTSVSKKETRIGDSPTAITVITQDDLRRMGVTTLPEALRLAPGIDVARIGPNQWAVSARGFNGEFATKLLILVDGRTLYSPSRGGVFWNSQDVLIDDIDRIEVIRGPGASLWGANAVNGVINVITKSARETAGGRASAVAGNDDNGLAKVRYGGEMAEGLYGRVFLKYFNRESFEDASGTLDAGHWNMLHGGFRTDWATSSSDALTLQGDAYEGRAGKVVNSISLQPPGTLPYSARFANSGKNLLARWNHDFDNSSAFTVQSYFDHVDQGDGYGEEHHRTYDLELQHHFRIGARNDVLWGAGTRYVASDENEGPPIYWARSAFDINFVNFFLQDQLSLIPQRLTATLGTKFEHNNLSGWFVDPNLRIAWTPSSRQTLWAAVARASRTPTEFELGAYLGISAFQSDPNAPASVVAIVPNPDLRPEQLLSYEIGYRLEPVPRVSLDLSTYFNHFSHLITQDAQVPQLIAAPSPYVVLGWKEENSQDARNFGFEVAAQWQASSFWKLLGSYTFLHMSVWPDIVLEHESPRNQFQLRSYLDLPWHLELNSALYYVDPITVPSGPDFVRIPSYVRLDAGLYWKSNSHWTVGLWGQNLTSARHLEFASNNTPLMFPVPRTWLLRFNLDF